MTFGEKLEKVRHDDPDFARSAKRLRVATWLFGTAVAIALAFAVWAVVVNGQQATQITKIESPCIRYGAKSDQCKEAFEQAVLTITHAQACAILRKAGLEIAECAHARLRQEHVRHNERVASGGQPERGLGGTAKPGGSGVSPAPGSNGGPAGVSPHSGGEHPHHAPQQPSQPQPTPQPSEPTSAPPATQPSSPQAEQSAEEVEPPASESPPSASPASPGLIENPGGVVGEVVCGLNRLLPVCSE